MNDPDENEDPTAYARQHWKEIINKKRIREGFHRRNMPGEIYNILLHSILKCPM